MSQKKNILKRIYLVYLCIFLFGVAIVARVCIIQFAEGEKWVELARQQSLAYMNIEAVRGNIFSSDGSVLATSIPIYEVRLDVNSGAITNDLFYKNVDSLSLCLSRLFQDKPAADYKKMLVRARKNNERYLLLKRKVSYVQLKQLRTFPVFRLGRYKGGLIAIQKNVRQFPFRLLASRTIGYDRESLKPVGLEGAYSRELKGATGKRLMQKIAGGVWMPVNDENEIEPQDGHDVVTTIDINIQDVAENALLEQLTRQNADHGTVVVMEVKTGHIKAIANLTRTSTGEYAEKYNYAIGESTEPGSTFKLASLMAAFEDGYLDLEDSVDTENGTRKFYDRVMKDSHDGGFGRISIKRVFEVSSNVGISKAIFQHYGKNPRAFTSRLEKMGIGQPLGLEISGEGKAKIKQPGSPHWYGTTLPWMSIGYELQLTPLQILTFYNAVANGGKMVKPMFVKEIRKHGQVTRSFPTVVLNEAIASKSTIEQARRMLEGVVENGTATNLKKANVPIAGKTGTAQIANDKYGYKYESKVSYQASLVGYFPANAPQYSCIIVVNAPSSNVYYGNDVAGPIFRNIADKIYSVNLDLHPEIDQKKLAFDAEVKKATASEVAAVLPKLGITAVAPVRPLDIVSVSVDKKHAVLKPVRLKEGVVPDVKGMGLKDALQLLESAGLSVKATGSGAVSSQSISAGEKVLKGSVIYLQLS